MSSGLVEGTTFAGRYRVVRRIAMGGMGAVYEVVHLETERRRALKVMHAHILQSADLRERFQREAKVAAHVESDFIVDVFDAGYDEATRMPFLVMELLRGEELGVRLKRLGRFSPSEVVTFLYQTAVALDKTHKASIVHRDLKPENLFLTDRDDGPPRIKVLDFGVAKLVAESATSGGPTQSIGTPLYMAPEQFNPNARLTGAADRYALAMMAYTLLVGVAYWADEARAGNMLALAMVAVHGPREPASARAARHNVMLSASFDAWFARSTVADPMLRPATAVEMVAGLGDALGMPSPVRAMMASTIGVTAVGPLGDGIDAPTLVISPAGQPAPVAATARLSTPITAPGTTATRPVPQSARSNASIFAAVVGSLLFFALLVAGALVLGRERTAAREAASASTTVGAVATAQPVASTVPVEASAIPADEPEVGATPRAGATTASSVVPATTALSGKTAVPVSRPGAAPSSSLAKPTTDPQRKMWARD